MDQEGGCGRYGRGQEGEEVSSLRRRKQIVEGPRARSKPRAKDENRGGMLESF